MSTLPLRGCNPPITALRYSAPASEEAEAVAGEVLGEAGQVAEKAGVAGEAGKAPAEEVIKEEL